MIKRLSPAQASYIKAKAAYDTVKQIELEVKTNVLAENKFYTDPREGEEPERIIKPSWDFLMSDEDFTQYCKLTFESYKKNGVDLPDYNTSPEYKVRNELRDAEQALIEWGMSVIKTLPQYKAQEKLIEQLKEAITYDMKIRDKVIELTLMVIPSSR